MLGLTYFFVFYVHMAHPCRNIFSAFSETISVVRGDYLHFTPVGACTKARIFYDFQITILVRQAVQTKLYSHIKTACSWNFTYTGRPRLTSWLRSCKPRRFVKR
jgi:hypothetical protein